MNILVLGASGLIGSTLFTVLSESREWNVFGTLRSDDARRFFDPAIAHRLVSGVDMEHNDSLVRLFAERRPDVVINCTGLTKHLAGADQVLMSVPINGLVPHRLAALCAVANARYVQISTDCVFAGTKGMYTETDVPDAPDIYGKSKMIGEVFAPHAITLRTSTIGHELQTAYGLLNWFLAQRDRTKGYKRAIFSGLPTVVLAQVVRDEVIPRPELTGLYHVAAEPIAKSDLLHLIAKVYGKRIEIEPDDLLVIDRSLSAERFRMATGYVAPGWPALVETMHAHHLRTRQPA